MVTKSFRRERYWAEIDLPDKITFYTEAELRRKRLLSELEEMRCNFRIYQKPVTLSSDITERLGSRGIEVLRENFLALKGRWHWFTGYSRMDAFRLTASLAEKLKKQGFVTINFKAIQLIKDKLFIVSCTKKKIWDLQASPKFVPAKDAYIGDHFKKWLNSENSKNFPWLVFSSKYGLIEPDHPIKNYDIELGREGSISEKTLLGQIIYHDFGFKVKDFKEVYFVGSLNYYNKLKEIFECAGINLRFHSKA